jgi:hypothetical protein
LNDEWATMQQELSQCHEILRAALTDRDAQQLTEVQGRMDAAHERQYGILERQRSIESELLTLLQ